MEMYLMRFILLFILLLFSCKAPRQACYESQCKNSVSSCYLVSFVKYNPLVDLSENITLPPPSYPNENVKVEPSTDGGNSFQSPYLMDLNYYRYTGTISEGDSADIYAIYIPTDFLVNKESPDFNLQISLKQESGSATCQTYTYSGSGGCTSTNSVACSNPVNNKQLSNTPYFFKSTEANNIFLYIKCSGNAGSKYSIHLAMILEKPLQLPKATVDNTTLSILSDRCALAESKCKKKCNQALPF